MNKLSLRSRILLVTSLPIIISTLVYIVMAIIFEGKIEKRNQAFLLSQQLIKNVFQMHESLSDVVRADVKSSHFFQEHKSNNTMTLETNYQLASDLLEKMLPLKESLGNNPDLNNKLKQKLQEYKREFNTYIKVTLSLGFKNWGTIGIWRAKIHALESIINSFKDFHLKSLMLMLRRHEKDYLLRNDEEYIEKMKKGVDDLLEYVNHHVNYIDKKTMRHLVQEYYSLFLNYVDSRKKQVATLELISKIEKDFTSLLVQINISIVNSALDLQKQLKIFVIFMLLISFGGAIILSMFFSKILMNPINLLVQKIKKLDLVTKNSLNEIHSCPEINILRDAIISLKDQTEDQEKLIESSAQMTTLGEVAANICHELLNPLSIISTSIETIKNKKITSPEYFPEKQFSFIDIATTQSIEIVRNIRKLSRKDFGSDFAEFELNNIFTPIHFLLGNKLKYANIALSIEGFDNRIRYLGSESLLSQVVLNLINNARQAIENLETRWIHIKTEVSKNFYRILILDSGQKVPPEIQKLLFKERITTKDRDEGTGLGLFLCKSIIERHGGNIYLDAEQKHTCFVIELPSANEKF